MNSEDLHPRVESDICGKCRKKFKPGDRVVTVFIIQKVGRDPANVLKTGSFIDPMEFELVHIDCNNPNLKKERI